MTENPIVEATVKPSGNALRLEWGMTVTDKRKWRWPKKQLEVRLYCEPFPDLRTPELLNTALADRQITYGRSFSIPFKVVDIGRSQEQSQSAFRPGMVFSGAEGRCYPLYFDLDNKDIPADGVICYPAVRWPVDSAKWRETPRTFRVQFGYTQDGKFEVVHEHHEVFPQEDTITEILPSRTIEEDLYVFISYARPNQAVAEQIEAYLEAAKVKVFRDTSEIRAGANWDMTIETALRKTHRMILLLSSSSMPYRKEVHREWFYFDQENKPIYPLYLEKCKLHSRMYAYNYMDVNRLGLQAALEQILDALGREGVVPEGEADRILIGDDIEVEERTLPESLEALRSAIREPKGTVALSNEQAKQVIEHKPLNLEEYRLCRIAEWSQERYQLDNRFVNLTLIIDRGEEADGIRWQPDEQQRRFKQMQEVLGEVHNPALVLLGAPGSGKSTLLRRLQLDHAVDRVRDDEKKLTFFIQLNSYHAVSDTPRQWLNTKWREKYPALPSLDVLLSEGRVMLLLDALNEMTHKTTAEYTDAVTLWKQFIQDVTSNGSRVIFSCRTLDYSATLSSKTLPVPHIVVQPMKDEQIQTFLNAYLPAQAQMVWGELKDSPQLDIFRTPYFLKLLCDQVEDRDEIPKGRAELFTGFVRQALRREIDGGNTLFQPDTLLTTKDHQRMNLNKWRTPFDLPERGCLIPRISQLAFTMQESGLDTEGAQIRADYDDACDTIDHDRAEDILKAGISLNVLDEDLAEIEILFFHQLLQEFFAARKLAVEPNPELVRVEWHADQVSPTWAETLAGLADSDPLPPLPQTGWEETTILAAAMAKKPEAFVRDLIAVNLPLAARCITSAEVKVSDELKGEIQQALIARTQDTQNADLRARIAAGLALGELGDPRFEHKTGTHGDYLLPPMVTIPAGTYTIGDDNSQYDDEKPQHTVELEAFELGQFPVTNAEYALFMAAGGYEDEQWWDTDDALAWLRGEGSTDGQKANLRDLWNNLQSWSEDDIRELVAQNRITSEQADSWIGLKGWSEDELESQLDEWYPSGQIYRQPQYWDDENYNNPAQPVVGITWYEARAYCKWLSAQSRQIYELPTEAQWEAAARSTRGWIYPYGNDFDVAQGNTFESHIRRTTPIGIYGATPEKIFDLSGNVYDWALSIYDQEHFPYPYRAEDGRENISSDSRRVLRGGSWGSNINNARCACRVSAPPGLRDFNYGFRLCRPPSL